MKYIRVENNSIIGTPTDLPISAHNISNFYLLPQETLRQYGWFPFEIEEVELDEHEVISRWETIIEETRVVRKPTKRILTQEEIDKKNQDKITKEWSDVRTQRNYLLSECDWTQISDAPITDENKQQWKIYRQDLRDITNASTPQQVVWPPQPPLIKFIPPPPVIQETSPIEETTNEESEPNLGG